jgi:L-ribulose-5-phosphate 4-epimerase
MLLKELREQVVQVGLDALAAGIVHGTAGNMSIRDPETGLIAISPSGIPYPQVTPEDVVIVTEDAEIVDGRRRPSSETPLHTMVMKARPDVTAIVHTHSHYSTVVACIRDYLPPILTEVAVVVGARVPVTRYGLTGTPDFGHSVIEIMTPDLKAVLLKNHGLITFGDSFAQALSISEIVEEAAEVYIHALAANGGKEPFLVPEDLIAGMQQHARANYGQPKEA